MQRLSICLGWHWKGWDKKQHHWTGWPRGNTLDLYPEGTWFKSPGHLRLLWFYLVLPGRCWDNTSIRPCPLPNPFQFIIHLSYRLMLDTVSTIKMKGKAFPVTCHGGTYGCQTSRLPHFLDSHLTGGSEVISLTRRLPFIPRKISGTYFC
jgi:hypothetical protein